MRKLAKSPQGTTGGRSIVNAKQVTNKHELDNGQIVNKPKALPPGVEGDTFGTLKVEVGNLEWLNYDGMNYLEAKPRNKSTVHAEGVYANITFWGEQPDKNGAKGTFLKFKGFGNNSFSYDIKCPEKNFEAYLDDMGALMIDLYDHNSGFTIGAAKVQLSLFIKRAKRAGDSAPLLEMRDQVVSVSLIGDHAVRIGEFKLNAVAQFKNNQMNRQEIDLNEETVQADYTDSRVPTSLKQNKASERNYLKDKFRGELESQSLASQNQKLTDERPVRDTNSNLPAKKRAVVEIEENEESNGNFAKLLARGERLRRQMDDALDTDNAWEQLHGKHNIEKTYVPPFVQDEVSKFQAENGRVPDMNDIEELLHIQDEEHSTKVKDVAPTNLMLPDGNIAAQSRQIMDMKYIYFKIFDMQVNNNQLVQKMINEGFHLEVVLPLPDTKNEIMSQQVIVMRNYEVLANNHYMFNSTSSFHFKVSELTLAQFSESALVVKLLLPPTEQEQPAIYGELKMNKMLLANNFQLQAQMDLIMYTRVVADTTGRTKAAKEEAERNAEIVTQKIGSINLLMNLQNEDQEEEARRNFALRMAEIEEQHAKQEEERVEVAKKRLQFNMEQAATFGTLYIHIDRVGDKAETSRDTQPTDSLNKRATGGDDQDIVRTSNENLESGVADSLARATGDMNKIAFPKRNLFVRFKAFPNLEQVRTSTIWQSEQGSAFDYHAQFPVIMTPEQLEKMEKFTLVFELWDQVSPAQEEFLGFVKVPLAPITYSMQTTDAEVYSLNFLADQFNMYPMMLCDGFLPIYSPKSGCNVGHLKCTVAMGSAIQVNRMISKDQEERDRRTKEQHRIEIIEAERRKEIEMKEERRKKKEAKRKEEEEKRKAEEERRKAEEDMNLANLLGSPGGKDKNASITKLLRQSLNSQLSANDYDQRDRSMLNCMRKLFEEARFNHITDLNGYELFTDDVKNFDGTVQKEEFAYSLLNHEKLTLTRTEVGQILVLLLDINRDDQGKVDVDELHFSFVSYLKYYEIIEQRVLDLLEKVKICVSKKLENIDALIDLTTQLESRATDSKISMPELRMILEDENGIMIRDALYDQLGSFFDLDRDNQVYISSIVTYLKDPSPEKINYFKVNKQVISSQITAYVKNSVESMPDCMLKLEEEFKQDIWRVNKAAIAKKKREKGISDDESALGDDSEIEVIPAELLLTEKINAKLFQHKLKRLGIALSLWEVFTLFEHLNQQQANKMMHEPVRYHSLMFGSFYELILNRPYTRGRANPASKPVKTAQNTRMERDEVPNQGKSNFNKPSKVYNLEDNGYRKRNQQKQAVTSQDNPLEDEIWERNDVEAESDERRPYEQIKHVFEIKVEELKNIPLLNKFLCQIENQHEAAGYMNEDQKRATYLHENKYIQNVAVKYAFPLDEDEVLESDYLQLNKGALDENGFYSYFVSMDTVHSYVLNKSDSIKKVLQLCQSRGQVDPAQNTDLRREELFSIQICLYQDSKEYVIGNAHLPIEDLIDTIHSHDTRSGTFDPRDRKTKLNRTLFIYGTSYSQRENCIIGKMQLNLDYSQQKQYLTKAEAKALAIQRETTGEPGGTLQNPYSSFMHRETYVNRKIPLNAKMSVLIDRVANLKESIENIEHFATIQHAASNMAPNASATPGFDEDEEFLYALNSSTMVRNQTDMQHLDRRRVLKHILKHGLNLIIRASVFEEDLELQRKFAVNDASVFEQNLSKYQTRILYSSLNPVFGEVFEMSLQMNTKIFEYLKNKRAVFEVRHYIIQSAKQKLNTLRQSAQWKGDNFELNDDSADDGTALEACDYIVLGYVKVPLLQLITKNNGVDGDFTIFDEFNQSMGQLRLRITLNHHNSQRPLYSTSSKIPNQVTAKKDSTLIEKSISLQGVTQKPNKLILGLDFIELLFRDRKNLTSIRAGLKCRFFLKYRLLGTNYQSRFLCSETGDSLSPLNILLDKVHLQRLPIAKSNFVELDLGDLETTEEAFGKPLQIELWYKVESLKSYEKPLEEQMIGQFFVELNDLLKQPNRRLKTEHDPRLPGKFEVFEGYFSMQDTQKDQLSCDRLGMRLYMFPKDDTNEMLSVEDMSLIFNQYRPAIEQAIGQKVDVEGKGYAHADKLVQTCKQVIDDEYLCQKLLWFIKSSLQFRNVDEVYYSPLFCLPPPFFKYANKFDELDIVIKMNEALSELDATANGFIAVNLFRNCLERELNIKSKIVEDFVNGVRDTMIENSNSQSVTQTCKEQHTLDVNLTTNSLRTSHIDFVVLLRKLAQYVEAKSRGRDADKLVKQTIMDKMNDLDDTNFKKVELHFEVDNAMRVKSPLSANEYPNSYVVMRPNFDYAESATGQFLQTPVIRANSYPMWNFKSKGYTLPLNQANESFLQQGSLEFEVFHQSTGYGDTEMSLEASNHLIGVAFVPLAPLVEGRGKTRLTGMFDIVPKRALYNSVNSIPSQATESLGKIKISVTTDKNPVMLLKEGPEQANVDFKYTTPVLATAQLGEDLAKKHVSFGKTTMQQQSNLRDSYSYNAYPSVAFTGQNVETEQRVYHETLVNKSEEGLSLMHLSNMAQLEDLKASLNRKMAVLDATQNAQVSPLNDRLVMSEAPKKDVHVNFATTMKTEAMQATVTEELKKVRAEQQLIDNPFASKNMEKEFDKVDEESLDERGMPAEMAQHFYNDQSEKEEDKAESPAFQLNENSEKQLDLQQQYARSSSLRKSIEDIDPEELERMERIMNMGQQ